MNAFIPKQRWYRVLPKLKLIFLGVQEKQAVKVYQYIKLLDSPHTYPRLHIYAVVHRFKMQWPIKLDVHVDEFQHRANPYTDKIERFIRQVQNS